MGKERDFIFEMMNYVIDEVVPDDQLVQLLLAFVVSEDEFFNLNNELEYRTIIRSKEFLQLYSDTRFV